ncbi:MAG: DUF4340 domain-containing protein [Clostridia bacterium]|nr:DUF4340 domain-containing protein [Clostridia bacterium]
MSLDDIKQQLESESLAEEVTTPAAETADTAQDPFSSFVEVNRVAEKKEKKTRFSKQTRTIIFTSAGAILLAVVLLLVTLLPSSDVVGSSGSAGDAVVDNSIVLVDKTVKDTVTVKQVDVRNESGEYTIFYNETEKIFQLKGYEDILLSKSMTDTLTAYTTVVSAADKVNNVDKLSTFGLDKPVATATITYKDGSTCTVSVGDMIPSEDGYYAQVSGDENVYMFTSDTAAIFQMMSVAFADTTLISTPSVKSDDKNGSAVLKEITYTGKNYPQPLHIRRSYHTDMTELTYYSYIISDPYLRGTNDATSGILTNFKSLSAVQALVLHPTEEQKKRVGFDNPLSVMNITMAVETPAESDTSETDDAEINTYYNSTTTKVTVGSQDEDGNYIVMVDGINAIFLVDKAVFSSVADRNYANSVNTLLFAKNIVKVSRIAIKTAENDCNFTLTHFPEAEESDDEMKVTQGDTTYSTQEFRELYTLMMSIMRYDTWEEAPSGESALTIHLYNLDGSLFLGADFYSISGSRFLVRTTKGEQFTTRSAEVNHFIKQVANYVNGEDVLTLT